MIIGGSLLLIKNNKQNSMSLQKSKEKGALSFGAKIFSNKQLDEIVIRYKKISQKEGIDIKKEKRLIKTKMAEILESRTNSEKRIFERELANRAVELEPKLKDIRTEEYKKYYKQNEYYPPEGKIGLLKQEASNYANRKLLEIMLGEYIYG